MDRSEIRFGCMERATALAVRFGKGDVTALAQMFYLFAGEDPRKLRALDIALTGANYRMDAQKYVEFAAEVMEFVDQKDTGS